MRIALLRAEALHLLRLAPVNAIRAEAHPRFAEPDVVRHLESAARIGVMRILENADVWTIARDDIVLCPTGKLVQPQRRFAPLHPIPRSRIEQVPAHVVHRAWPI